MPIGFDLAVLADHLRYPDRYLIGLVPILTQHSLQLELRLTMPLFALSQHQRLGAMHAVFGLHFRLEIVCGNGVAAMPAVIFGGLFASLLLGALALLPYMLQLPISSCCCAASFARAFLNIR